MPRYVLLRHECLPEYKPSHWDLMLEVDGVLATWELSDLPAAWAAVLNLEQREIRSPMTVTRLPDHRLAYLDYEGPVSGNRGSVTRIAGGSCKILESNSAMLLAILHGESLRGEVKLTRVKDSDRWELVV